MLKRCSIFWGLKTLWVDDLRNALTAELEAVREIGGIEHSTSTKYKALIFCPVC